MIEYKWLLTAFAVVMSCIALGDALTKYADNQCRVAAISANVAAVDIDKACGKTK